jgi:hypothetical protein
MYLFLTTLTILFFLFFCMFGINSKKDSFMCYEKCDRVSCQYCEDKEQCSLAK